MNITKGKFKKLKTCSSYNVKMRNRPITIQMRADDDFKSISIRAYVHMCSKSYSFGTVNSIEELNETYAELVTTLNAATSGCKKCQDYHSALSKLANKPKIPKSIIEKDNTNPMLHKTCLIDRTYYRDRLHELEKRHDEWEEKLNFAQINLNSINHEINKLRDYVFKSSNQPVQVKSSNKQNKKATSDLKNKEMEINELNENYKQDNLYLKNQIENLREHNNQLRKQLRSKEKIISDQKKHIDELYEQINTTHEKLGKKYEGDIEGNIFLYLKSKEKNKPGMFLDEDSC